MTDFNSNDWKEHRKLILADLQRHEEILERILAHINSLRTEVALLQLRASIWGLAAGCVPVILLLVIQYMKTGIK